MFDTNQLNSFTVGEIIDERYQLLGVIGSGAMGTVIRCADMSLRNSDVVLKFLKQEYIQDAKQFERFKNEALLMRELNHPNIVHVYDLRCLYGSNHYITMEYIEGSSLKTVLEDIPENLLPFKDALKILKEIASGMSYAHQKGIIHRDLKPDNVLVSSDGEVKLTDFGLGKTLFIAEDITDLGEAVGTPHYMSPEQLRGQKLDKRCDIYSFGILAYELVTGKKPYPETNYLKLAAKHINDPLPKIINKNGSVPNWFNDFLTKCCAKEREQRFQSFDEILNLIQSFLETGKVSGIGFSQKRAYWMLRLHLEKWKAKRFFYVISFIFLCLTFIIMLGRSNPAIRLFYAPTILNFEESLEFDFSRFKSFAFGEKFGETFQKDNNSLFLALESGNLEALKIILKTGISAKVTNQTGKTLLNQAISLGNNKAAEQIIAYLNSNDINTPDQNGDTALGLATKSANQQIVKELIKRGANVNLLDGSGRSPIKHAVVTNKAMIVKMLLSEGAIQDQETLDLAQKSKNKEIIEACKKIGAKSE